MGKKKSLPTFVVVGDEDVRRCWLGNAPFFPSIFVLFLSLWSPFSLALGLLLLCFMDFL
jgi:hypothetical protein